MNYTYAYTIASVEHILSDQECYDFLGTDDSNSNTPIITTLRDSVEIYLREIYWKRNLISTEYRKDRYDGNGTRRINLRNYPITNVARVSINTEQVIKITHTIATSTVATVSVNYLGVVLNYNWTSTTLSFTTYPTITLMVNAINAQSANGWSASLMSSQRASYRSDELLDVMGQSVRGGTQVYLQIPYQPEYEFDVYPEYGQLDFFAGFPKGFRNIIVDYTAGYQVLAPGVTQTNFNIPLLGEDIKLGIKILLKHIYQKRQEETFSLDSYSISGLSMSFQKEIIPRDAVVLLSKYRRHVI